MWIGLAWLVVMAALIWWGENQAASGGKLEVTLPGNTGLDLVWIRPGTFLMGSPASEPGRPSNEGPQTQVILTKGFWLGKFTVTQRQWLALMGNNPSFFIGAGLDAPVEQVSWDEAMAFCHKLTAQERAAGRLPAGFQYTLPTAAQWEYACRAGTTGPYPGPVDSIAWYNRNSGGTTHAVGTKLPNAWGLYDMNGNIWQWCADWAWDYPGGLISDPVGPASGTIRIDRGGAWGCNSDQVRSAFIGTNGDPPASHQNVIGFRVALAVVRP